MITRVYKLTNGMEVSGFERMNHAQLEEAQRKAGEFAGQNLRWEPATTDEMLDFYAAEFAATKAELERAQLALRDSREAAKRYMSKWGCYEEGNIGNIHMREFLEIAERGLGDDHAPAPTIRERISQAVRSSDDWREGLDLEDLTDKIVAALAKDSDHA